MTGSDETKDECVLNCTHFNELILVLFRHRHERVILSLQLSAQTIESVHHNLLHLTSLGTRAEGREGKTPDAATGAHARGEDVLGVELGVLQLQTTKTRNSLELRDGTIEKKWSIQELKQA